MTIIAGFTCKDGVVLASDSQASAGATRRMETKLFAGPAIIYGLTGSETTIHLLRDHFRTLALTTTVGADIGHELGSAAGTILGAEYARVLSVLPGLPLGSLPGAGMIVGAYAGSNPLLCQINELATPLICTSKFTADGSGSTYAIQAEAVFKELRTYDLTLYQTTLLAVRIVQAALEIAGPTAAIGGPIRIATLEGAVGAPAAAKVLAPKEVDVLIDQVREWVAVESGNFARQAPP